MSNYHLQFFGPEKTEYVSWPAESVSVYRINGDQIAHRIKFNADGKVVERHSWCGYLGCFKSLADAVEAIKKDRAECEQNGVTRKAAE